MSMRLDMVTRNQTVLNTGRRAKMMSAAPQIIARMPIVLGCM